MLISDTKLGSRRRKCSPAVVVEIDINELVICNTDPELSKMRVLKMIPSDSPQLTRQNETRTITKYMVTVRCRFTATSTRENKMPVTISNGTSRIRYVKKNELMEYALSAYSYRGVRKQTTLTTNAPSPYPIKDIPFQRVLANVLQEPRKVHLPSGEPPHHQHCEMK